MGSASSKKFILTKSRILCQFEMESLTIVPAIFLKYMDYHFDGLATVLNFTFQNGKLRFFSKACASDLFEDPQGCVIFESGTGPSLGYKVCFRNPIVNLPINEQLWRGDA